VDNFPHQVISYLDGQRDTMSGPERQHFLGQYSQKLVQRLEAKIIELEQANQKLQKVDKLKSDFITLAAHELRTPITLIYGYARLLQMTTMENCENAPAAGSPGDLARRIFDSVHRLNETINDILNISLIESNQMYLVREPISLIQVINAAFRELNRTNPERLLTVGFDHSLTSLPTIIGDPQRLQQVFWNLFSNAIKFTPDGGSISVKGWIVAARPAEVVQSFAPASEGGVVVAVADTGVGIDPADQANIFDRFYIVANTAYHSSSKTAFQGGGLGLGLSITRGIIQAHGGGIWVESPGHDSRHTPGSTFFVFLPLGDSPPYAK
jgi:signal transduction histidine kinase